MSSLVKILKKYQNKLTEEELEVIELVVRSVDVDDPKECRRLIERINSILLKIDPEDKWLMEELEGYKKWLEFCVKCGENPDDPECTDLLDYDIYDDI